MFGISERCYVNQIIFKKDFLNNADLNKNEVKILTEQIDKIILHSQLAESTSNIKAYKDDIREYTLINLFTVEVKGKANTQSISQLIMSAIPYLSIIVFKQNGKMQLSVCHQRTNQSDNTKNVLDEIIMSEWIEYNDTLFDINSMSMTNCFTLYSDIVDFISIENAKLLVDTKVLTGEEARIISEKIADIENQISKLRLKLKKESDFDNKIDINMKIKKLEKNLIKIKENNNGS